MLPPFIIEQIRQREEREKRHSPPQPFLELPLGPAVPPREPLEREDTDRGVVIIDLLAD